MRILLSIHHRLVPGAGAPGATLALADALRRLGHEADTLSFDSVARVPGDRARELLFPELAALRLRKLAGRYDVVDASTGDAWLWAAPALRAPRLSRARTASNTSFAPRAASSQARAGSANACTTIAYASGRSPDHCARPMRRSS